ncbi:hypothetical protein ACJZ2D_013531 [Fusarium nematophilum]
MSPTYTLSAHLSKNLFASLRERRRSSADSHQERPVLSDPFTTSLSSASPQYETVKSGQENTSSAVSWASTTQPSYSDLRKVATK